MSMHEVIEKIKRLSGMSDTLCDKCQHWQYCSDRHNECVKCEQYGGDYYCKCSDAENVEECPHFKQI